MRRLRIGVLSLAHVHALGYLQLLLARSDVEVAVSDPDADRRPPGEPGGRTMAEQAGAARYFDSHEALLDWAPDAVVVCAENVHHRALTELAASAGAHVLCEKPLATTVADGQAMIEACDRAGVWLMVAYPVRFARPFRALAASVPSLGTLVAATGSNTGKLPGGRAWFADPVLAGGGAIMDHTVHVADLLDVLLDGAEPESVFAVANHAIHGPTAVETGGLVSLRYPGGLVATVDCSWSVPAHRPGWGGLTLRLVGTDGIADLDAFRQILYGFTEPRRAELRLEYGESGDAPMLAEFLAAIRQGRRPQPDGETGLRTLRTVERAYRSVRDGTPA